MPPRRDQQAAEDFVRDQTPVRRQTHAVRSSAQAARHREPRAAQASRRRSMASPNWSRRRSRSTPSFKRRPRKRDSSKASSRPMTSNVGRDVFGRGFEQTEWSDCSQRCRGIRPDRWYWQTAQRSSPVRQHRVSIETKADIRLTLPVFEVVARSMPGPRKVRDLILVHTRRIEDAAQAC